MYFSCVMYNMVHVTIGTYSPVIEGHCFHHFEFLLCYLTMTQHMNIIKLFHTGKCKIKKIRKKHVKEKKKLLPNTHHWTEN